MTREDRLLIEKIVKETTKLYNRHRCSDSSKWRNLYLIRSYLKRMLVSDDDENFQVLEKY